MWNFHLLRAAFGLREPDQARPESDPAEADDTSQADAGKYSRWVLPLIHGFVDQASELQEFDKNWAQLTIASRRNTCAWPHGVYHRDRPPI